MPPPATATIQFFFFNDTATTEIYTLSLHDALPICARTTRVVVDGGLGFSAPGAYVASKTLTLSFSERTLMLTLSCESAAPAIKPESTSAAALSDAVTSLLITSPLARQGWRVKHSSARKSTKLEK